MKVAVTLGAAAVAAALACAPASAQSLRLMTDDIYRPAGGVELTAPTYFEGLYAGVLLGMSGADHKNFFPTGGIDRFGIGAVVGYNTYVAPRVVLGAEVHGHLDTDFAGTFNTGLLGFGKLGFTTADNVMVYVLGGAGVFDNTPAWALGLGLEWGVYENVSIRADITTIGQAGPSPSNITIPGITAWIIKGGALWHFGEGSSGVQPFSFVDNGGEVTDFDGPYAGIGYGMHYNTLGNFFPDVGFGAHITRGNIGVFGGYNMKLMDSGIGVVAGVEAQGDFLYDTSGDTGFEVLGLARLGVVPVEGLMVYGAAGAGLVNNGTAAYALGGGAEYALWGNTSLRAEYLALGEIDGAPAGFTGHKGTIGAVWHY